MSSSGGKVLCNHGEEAAMRKSNTPKHPNREFYCCKKPQGDQTRCKFFRWVDDLPSETIVHASSSHSPSKEGAHSSGRPTSSPYTRSSQKHSSSSTSPAEMANRRSRKRLEDIEAGLKQREIDLSPARRPGPSGEPCTPLPCTPLPIAPTVPQPPSPVPTEVDSNEVEAQPRKTYSFLGLHDSPEPVVSVIKDEGRPSTPKKRRTHSQPAPSGDGLLLTPPQSTQRITEFDQTKSLPVIMRSRKGKEREGAPVPTEDRDVFNSGEQSEDSLPLFTLPDDVSRIPSVSPTSAENVLDYSDGMKARVKALSEYMDSFDITRAAKLLQTVERQKIQYEYRDKSQMKRIEELVAERDKLAAEVVSLKEALRLSEDKSILLKDVGV